MNRTPKLANLWGVFMAKYTDGFKFKVINHYLNRYSYHHTAQTYGIDHKQVETWVKLYQIHGVDGICRRKSKAIYPAEFKHNVALQMLAGKSIQSLATEFNISSPSALRQYLEAKNACLKKLDALIRQKNQSKPKTKP